MSCSRTLKELAYVVSVGLFGISYNTGVSLIRAASQKAQQIHNAQVQAVDTDAIGADELWSFVEKNKNSAYPKS